MKRSTTHIGDEIEFYADTDNRLVLRFLPLDFFDHWERGSTVSDFVADYYRHNFPNPMEQNLISTVCNELVENSVKFSRNNSSEITVECRKRGLALLVSATNVIPHHRKAPFMECCHELFAEDLEELYLRRIEKGAVDSRASGIGLILIKKDYSSGLCFDFRADDYGNELVVVTTELTFEGK